MQSLHYETKRKRRDTTIYALVGVLSTINTAISPGPMFQGFCNCDSDLLFR